MAVWSQWQKAILFPNNHIYIILIYIYYIQLQVVCWGQLFFSQKPVPLVNIPTPSTHINTHIPHSVFCTIQHWRNAFDIRNFKKWFSIGYFNCKHKIIIDNLSSNWALDFLRNIPGSKGKDWVGRMAFPPLAPP